ncbi:hypothetical protein MGG_16412 [Pyricularia oryzae 70-15]|uniref:Uncharacterized protein n=1 Tax=Pyricularia oryzae (strain 70-15 / ATCC MYA-4617 / FGSC 8958) TaxID=242507 RepID=G4MN36_PYRO7|nr:uncharacterized protein MGG_16412 [Pyricularia oryzae 70-15]EHA57850.1 hypothetical protein MGG_16412 [Pyricularia oryzae 70-15]
MHRPGRRPRRLARRRRCSGGEFAARAVGFHGQADTTCQPTPLIVRMELVEVC